MNILISKLSILYKKTRLDQYERDFVENSPFHADKITDQCAPKVLIQMPMDYFYVSLFSTVSSQIASSQNSEILGLWPYNIKFLAPTRAGYVQSLYASFWYQIIDLLDRCKWKRIYHAAGVNDRYRLGKVGIIKNVTNFIKARKIWKSLKSKWQLIQLELNDVHCGDLIYDTYIRFHARPTVDLNDTYLAYVIWQCLNAQSSFRHLLVKNRIKCFISGYSTYVQHGIPVREALKAGVEVYTAGTYSQYLKKLSVGNYLHAPDYWTYADIFEGLKEKEHKKQIARKLLEQRFFGGVDSATKYMRISAYSSNYFDIPAHIEGVVFLHDFFDSPHCYRSMLFEDYWEWAVYTLELIQDHDLNLAVKPHPNQVPESVDAVNRLMQAFPDITWLDSGVSNKSIFESGISSGISVSGTILHELAYHGIVAIAAGDHPHVAFDIAYTPSSIEQYRDMVLHHRKLSLFEGAKDAVLKFYYMHNLYDKEPIDTRAPDLRLRNLSPHNSESLAEYLRLINETN